MKTFAKNKVPVCFAMATNQTQHDTNTGTQQCKRMKDTDEQKPFFFNLAIENVT